MENANINGLSQDCSNSIANALELLQSCTKPSIYYMFPQINSAQNSSSSFVCVHLAFISIVLADALWSVSARPSADTVLMFSLVARIYRCFFLIFVWRDNIFHNGWLHIDMICWDIKCKCQNASVFSHGLVFEWHEVHLAVQAGTRWCHSISNKLSNNFS